MTSTNKNENKTNNIILTKGQQNAYTAFIDFLLTPNTPYFLLEGYAGTGKSTLVKYILDNVYSIFNTIRLSNPKYKEPFVILTATTNKAVNALREITGNTDIKTIHSFLKLNVRTDYNTGITELNPTYNTKLIKNSLVFIDEASFIDSTLLDYIFKYIDYETSKIVFMGDPAQLTPVKSSKCPAFNLNIPKASLTEVVRQAKGNPIIDLATKFREVVNGGEFFSFTPDNIHIKHLSKSEFDKEIKKEFSREDWRYQDSKILAWRNATVIKYNYLVKSFRTGSNKLNVGDWAVNNSYISNSTKGIRISTDELVLITGIDEASVYGVEGYNYHIATAYGEQVVFNPKYIEDKKRVIKEFKDKELVASVLLDDSYTKQGFSYWLNIKEIEETWADLREVYACTINKSQGSTYDKVFIDLSDIAKCRNANQIARMLYVAVSRARKEVIFTGDLV